MGKKNQDSINHYLQAKKGLHCLKILGKVAPNQSSQRLVSHPNIREELGEVILQREEKENNFFF